MIKLHNHQYFTQLPVVACFHNWLLLGLAVLIASMLSPNVLAHSTHEHHAPEAQSSVGATSKATSPKMIKKKVGLVLFSGFEALDVYGPLEVWSYVADFELYMVAQEIGPIMSAQGVATVATHSFATAPDLDVVMVPGGLGSRSQLLNTKMLEFIQRADKNTTYTTSVCTGSALLAKAGVLDGQRATSNKRFFFLSEQQSDKVDWVAEARWVESGKYITSSGVSAGMDMALGLVAKEYGKKKANTLASLIEYEWNDNASQDAFTRYTQRLLPEQEGPITLSKQVPAAGAVLTASPEFIRIYFNKRPDVSASDIVLLNEYNQSIPVHHLHGMGANDLMIIVSERLPQGAYRVMWQAGFTQLDKPLSGSYEFVVADF